MPKKDKHPSKGSSPMGGEEDIPETVVPVVTFDEPPAEPEPQPAEAPSGSEYGPEVVPEPDPSPDPGAILLEKYVPDEIAEFEQISPALIPRAQEMAREGKTQLATAILDLTRLAMQLNAAQAQQPAQSEPDGGVQ